MNRSNGNLAISRYLMITILIGKAMIFIQIHIVNQCSVMKRISTASQGNNWLQNHMIHKILNVLCNDFDLFVMILWYFRAYTWMHFDTKWYMHLLFYFHVIFKTCCKTKNFRAIILYLECIRKRIKKYNWTNSRIFHCFTWGYNLVFRLFDVCPGARTHREMKLMLVFEHIDQDLAQFLERCPSPGLGPDMIRVWAAGLAQISYLRTMLTVASF